MASSKAASSGSDTELVPLEAVSTDGGVYSSSYPLENILKRGGKAYSSKNGKKTNVAIILKVTEDAVYKLQAVDYFGPGSSYTAPAGPMLLLVSATQPSATDVHAFDGAADLEAARATAAASGARLTPVLHFAGRKTTSRQGHKVPSCPPFRFLAVLVHGPISGTNGGNVDVGCLELRGVPASLAVSSRPPLGAGEPLRYADFDGVTDAVPGATLPPATQAAMDAVWGGGVAPALPSTTPASAPAPAPALPPQEEVEVSAAGAAAS